MEVGGTAIWPGCQAAGAPKPGRLACRASHGQRDSGGRVGPAHGGAICEQHAGGRHVPMQAGRFQRRVPVPAGDLRQAEAEAAGRGSGSSAGQPSGPAASLHATLGSWANRLRLSHRPSVLTCERRAPASIWRGGSSPGGRRASPARPHTHGRSSSSARSCPACLGNGGGGRQQLSAHWEGGNRTHIERGCKPTQLHQAPLHHYRSSQPPARPESTFDRHVGAAVGQKREGVGRAPQRGRLHRACLVAWVGLVDVGPQLQQHLWGAGKGGVRHGWCMHRSPAPC